MKYKKEVKVMKSLVKYGKTRENNECNKNKNWLGMGYKFEV